MPTSTTGKSTEAGFTLVELAVVVLLLGLFTALTVPMLAGFGEDDLRASARRLAGTVKYLYNEAALTGREHRLIYNLDRGTFRAARLETNGELKPVAGPGREQRLRGESRFRDVQVAARGKFSAGEVTTEVLPVGWLPETVVHLDAGREKTLTVRLLPLTGDVEIFEGYREF